MTNFDKIVTLTKQLYPTGRAFKMPKNGWLESLHGALALSETRAYEDAYSILNSILPDNANFTEQDATDWEKRLGMIISVAPLEDRKLAIQRKLNHPGNIKARQNYRYLELQLQAAGFDVYVTENRFPDGLGGYITKSPLDISGGGGISFLQHGQRQHGQRQHGGSYANKVANNIDENIDKDFEVGVNLRSTFFIGSNDLSSPGSAFKNVLPARKDEFRQLILKLKPVQTVAYLFITYI